VSTHAVSMSDPKTAPKPPFSDLVDTIKEARRHAKALQKAPLRREQIQQLYTLLNHLRFLDRLRSRRKETVAGWAFAYVRVDWENNERKASRKVQYAIIGETSRPISEPRRAQSLTARWPANSG